jgi:hypothetical protein
VRDASGELQKSRPILDTVITIPAQERNGTEFIRALCDELSSATEHKIVVGIVPSNALAQVHIKAGYENLSARQVLEDFLNKMPMGNRYTWALLFQKDYALNIHLVRDPYKPAEGTRTQSGNGRSRFIEERTLTTNSGTVVRVVR